MIVYRTEKRDVFCTGDIHGNFGVLSNFIRTRLSNCSIICCGDIGVGFEKCAHYDNVFGRISEQMDKIDVDLYMLRGNHDDPTYFNPDGRDYGRVHLVPDYSLLDIDGVGSVLMIGGATSVDRRQRIESDRERALKYLVYHGSVDGFIPCYWDGEAPFFSVDKMNDIKKHENKVVAVCTHTSPHGCDPLTTYGIESFIENDGTLSECIENERNVLDNVRTWLCDNGMKPSAWVYGHYHRSNREFIDGTLYALLDMCDTRHNKLDIFDLTNMIKGGNGGQE